MLRPEHSAPEPSAAPDKPQKRPKIASSSRRGSVASLDGGGATLFGSVGSNNDVELLDENLLRNNETRATGFVGRNSEVQWLRSLKTQKGSTGPGDDSSRSQNEFVRNAAEMTMQGTETPDARRTPSKLASILHVSDSSFYLDRDNIHTDIEVDPYEMPAPDTAELLLNCYMQTVHSSFPVLPDGFREQFQNYNDSVRRKRPLQIPDNWRAMLNLALAIGAQHSHLIRAEWRADERDHLIYMTRAIRILGLDNIVTSLSAPKLSLIRGTGLLSLYYLTIGHVGRAWMMIGISLRFALAAGLHVQNDDLSASSGQKGSLVRIWWSLHSIESLICGIIGRPCIIPHDECTVPLPDAAPREQPSSVSGRVDSDPIINPTFLGARAKIALIMQKTLSKLYSPQKSVDSWAYVQREIVSLATQLDEWVVTTLPKGASQAGSVPDLGIQREQLLLRFYYQSARLILFRPCLCRLERRTKNQSVDSAHFNQKTASACVEAAQSITQLLPEQPDLAFVYQQGPWWCMVHYIMQALAVFLLEMSFRESHAVGNGDDILKSIKKLVRWLQFMSQSNAVAERAYKVATDIILTGTEQVRIDISDILAEDEVEIGTGSPNETFLSPCNEVYSLDISNEIDNIQATKGLFKNTTGASDFQSFTFPGQEQHTSFEQPQFPQYIMPDTDLSIFSAFGNPFITGFDQYNLIDPPVFQQMFSN